MNSRQLLAVVVALAILGEGYWWLTRRSSSTDVREAPTIEYHSASNVKADPPPTLLPIPEPAKEPVVEAAADPRTVESQREAAPPAPAQDFESKYEHKTVAELQAAAQNLSKQGLEAQTALFDELFPKFPELLAEGRCGARILKEGGDGFSTPEGKGGSARWVVNEQGIREGRYLEISLEEPAIRDILVEQKWLIKRIGSLTKKN